MPFNHPILCCPLLLLPSIFPSIMVFSNESVIHINWPKYRSFSFSISPSNEYSGLISFPFSSVAQSCLTLCVPMDYSKPGFCVHHQLLEITRHMSFESVVPSNHLIVCHLLLLLPSIYPRIRVFSNESDLHIRWPKYRSFSFSISPSSEYSRLISFRMDWLDLLAVQETLKRLLQHHSSKASILWLSAFYMVQLSHPYMTTGKT